MRIPMKIADVLGCIVVCLFIGFMFGVAVVTYKIEMEYRESPTVAEQHESIMLDHEWLYCPYCGEKLEVEE
jgi:uncharacterized protein YneF (UPF0154 family)